MLFKFGTVENEIITVTLERYAWLGGAGGRPGGGGGGFFGGGG